VHEALRSTIGDTAQRIETAAGALAEAATGLKDSTAGLLPQLQALGPELDALAREVALLSARADREVEPLLAEEMVRIGDGMARLEQLMAMAKKTSKKAERA
jgi:hypothetical protein